MAGKVIIGCKLPHGIILSHPENAKKTVYINGLNKSKIIGATHTHTEMDEDFWNAWHGAHKSFPAVKSGAIFVAKSKDEAHGKSREMEGVKTGFEPMPQDAMGVKKDKGE